MIFCCGREYDLLYSMLYILDNNIQNVTFIISKELPSLGYYEKVLKLDFVSNVIVINDNKLHENYFFNYKWPLVGTVFNLLLLTYKTSKVYKNNLEMLIKSNSKKDATMHMFFANTGLKIYLLKKFSSVVFLEEGHGIYHKKYPKTYLLLRKLLRLGDPYGRDDKVKKIVLTKPNEYLNCILPKKEKFMMRESLERNINNNQLMKVFSLKSYSIPAGNKIAVILTQPLSEDMQCSETQKIEFYSKIYSQLEGAYVVFIKLHPRDRTIYPDFPIERVLEAELMIELIDFNQSIDLAININSTAASNMRNCRKIITLLPEQEFDNFDDINLSALDEL